MRWGRRAQSRSPDAWNIQDGLMPTRLVHIVPTLDQGGAEKQLCLLCANLDRQKYEPMWWC